MGGSRARWWIERGLSPARSMPPRLRDDVVPRPRVRALLDARAEHPVLVVAGPAGAGKTVALAQWGAPAPGGSAWLTLDATDDDPATLMRDLLGALAGAGLVPEPGAWPRPGQPLDARAWSTEHVVLPLWAAGPPVTLVLDDTHTVVHEAAWAVVERLIHERPPRLRLVLAGRTPPRLPLARLEAEGVVGRLEARDLWLDRAESDALVDRLRGTAVDDAERASLYQRSRGWPAALRLLLVAGASSAGASSAGASSAGASSGRALDYLAEEIIDAMPPELRRALVDTAVVDPVTPALAEALGHGHDPSGLLEGLVDAGLAMAVGEGLGVR
ncbi:MAG: hypothetical protein KDK70_32365, partial [Myxococcales bacterium]|nr:hypothetical protein [Myxococcales bacterium]